MSRPQRMDVSVGECARLHLEAVVPIPVAQTFHAVAYESQVAGLPLLQHVTVLMQHEPGIFEEVLRGITQIDAPPASGGNGAMMKPRIQGMLDDANVGYGLADHPLQRAAEGIRKNRAASRFHGFGV